MSDPSLNDRPRYGERAEPRPAPKYGEYAPPGWVSPVPPPEEPQIEPEDARVGAPRRTGFPTTQAPPPSGSPVEGEPPAPARRGFNVYASVLLLGIGLVSVLENLLSASSVGPRLLVELKNYGYPTNGFSNEGLLSAAGVASSFFALVVYIVVAVITVRRLRANKVAWVLPLVAGVVVYGIVAAALAAVVLTDPSVLSYLKSHG